MLNKDLLPIASKATYKFDDGKNQNEKFTIMQWYDKLPKSQQKLIKWVKFHFCFVLLLHLYWKIEWYYYFIDLVVMQQLALVFFAVLPFVVKDIVVRRRSKAINRQQENSSLKIITFLQKCWFQIWRFNTNNSCSLMYFVFVFLFVRIVNDAEALFVD